MKKNEEAIKQLQEIIKEGDVVYTLLQNVSSNGMSRRIVVLIPQKTKNGLMVRDITYLVAAACELRYNKDRHALVVGGCGMDMGYHVIYTLASVLGYKKSGENKGNCYGLAHQWL
jgi:hypothetical protein